MRIIRNQDGTVGKYLHEDGAETAIKSAPSCDAKLDRVTGKLVREAIDRNKWSIFLSSSAGCFVRCAFCHLTAADVRYRSLEGERIILDAKEAILAELDANPSLADRHAKICWMGMGEDHLARPDVTRSITNELARWLIDEGMAVGIDGVDLSTTLPRKLDDDAWIGALSGIEADLAAFAPNPNRREANGGRTRLFWSLHSEKDEIRRALIPGARAAAESAKVLRTFRERSGLSLVIHHLVLDGINDADEDVLSLRSFLAEQGLDDAEFRILRHNPARGSAIKESPRAAEISARFDAILPSVKMQVSTGAEIMAACGQFIAEAA
jgi:adenine C2-methylase RlmN of 23S rRNA A2503 and tRNA A37